MPFGVTEVQPTPNPNALKFVLDREISSAPMSFLNPASAAGHPLAERLFAIEGVTSLLLLGDFVTVNKRSDVHWDQITPRVREVLGGTKN